MRQSRPTVLPDAVRVGTVELGQYGLREVLYRGHSDSVFLAVREGTDTEAVVRVARRPQDASRYAGDLRAWEVLAHPNVAEVYDYGVIEGTPDVFFTSEFIDGVDLLAATEGMSEEEAAEAIADAEEAAEEAAAEEAPAEPTAGWKNGFFIQSEDGKSKLKIEVAELLVEQQIRVTMHECPTLKKVEQLLCVGIGKCRRQGARKFVVAGRRLDHKHSVVFGRIHGLVRIRKVLV